MESAPLISGDSSRPKHTFGQFLNAFWPLCLISFGGPQVHVALMQDKFVDVPDGYPGPTMKRSVFLQLFSLAQALPGPGSTQLVCSLGATYGGLFGAAITFFIWHIIGFVIMTAAGLWFHENLKNSQTLHFLDKLTDYCVGLIAAAFAFVVVAAFSFVKNTSTDAVKVAIMLLSMFVAIVIPAQASSWVYIILLVGGGLAYYFYERMYMTSDTTLEANDEDDDEWEANVSPVAGALIIAAVFVITVVIAIIPGDTMANKVLKIFWRIGLLVFGGGIVVIPMLLNEFVESGLLPTSVFLAGFSLFGCVPGPMFNLAPFLGAATAQIPGAFYGSLGLFGPGCLLQIGLLPYWERVRKMKIVKTILNGTNAAAVGLIVAGVWLLMKKALSGPAAFGLIVTAGLLKVKYNLSPALIIVSHGLLGFLLVTLGLGGPFHVIQDPISALPSTVV